MTNTGHDVAASKIADNAMIPDDIADDIPGHEPLARLLADDTLPDLMVNGSSHAWLERADRLSQTSVGFNDDTPPRPILHQLLPQVGPCIVQSSPTIVSSSRVQCKTAPSWTPVRAPITMRLWSPRNTVCGQLVDPGPITTLPMMVPSGCTNASGSIRGSLWPTS